VLGYFQPVLSKLAFLDRLIWIALAENKSAISGVSQSVP